MNLKSDLATLDLMANEPDGYRIHTLYVHIDRSGDWPLYAWPVRFVGSRNY